MITDRKDGGDEAPQRWILRFDKTPSGQRCKAAFLLLDLQDVVSKAISGSLRPDRAPKGTIIRTIEAVLEAVLGKKKRRR